MLKLLLDKLKESSSSVIPIILLVLVLNFTIAQLPLWRLFFFLVSAIIMIIGIALFNLGVDISLIPIGEHVGSSVVKSRKLTLIVLVTFLIGVFITVAEPDLILLAAQIGGVPDPVVIFTVAIGVGLAIVLAFMRILFRWRLSYVLIGLYTLAMILSRFTSINFLSIAWESGAVSTGPILVPFVMALGLGLASIRGDKATHEDSFGLVALTLISPIIAVLILGVFFSPVGGSTIAAAEVESLADIARLYKSGIAAQLGQVAIALAPILGLFAIFQVLKLRLRPRALSKIAVGTVYTYLGLVLFLASANVGFMPAGYLLGSLLVANSSPWVLPVVGLVMGYLVVSAEPAVFVLKRQVEDATAGAISGKSMGLALSVGVGLSVALAMVRVATGLSVLYFVAPGYILALLLTFVVPKLFSAIAFDSGAVASGPLAATFMLPFAIGASETIGGNIFTDAFGIVALVALFPVITLQLFGARYALRSRRLAHEMELPAEETIIDIDEVPEPAQTPD
ncbi:MAG: DUF1538 domain-containing protein [Firmicutes bacterium]|jgi:hypothetical protein|nr:DUF1538 domain-containing protein [Bacillota bacterium]HKM17151.1 DUF1538 domain-containing protein [Limnochordia bacterium]